jgi:hypothetical protein
MNPNLSHAVLQFLANEFQSTPENLLPDTDFVIDFGLTPDQLTDLLDRIQDALDFVLPEEKIPEIHTISDLLQSLNPDPDTHEPV